MAAQDSVTSGSSAAPDVSPGIPLRTRFIPEPAEPTHSPSKTLWALVAAGALLVLVLGWHFLSSNNSESAPAAGRPTPVASSGTSSRTPAAPAPVSRPGVPAAAASPVPIQDGTLNSQPGASGWYVIAFTYNHEGQAAEKVKRLRRTHDSLHPQVFTPTGHTPYLISLGGPMSTQDEAEAVYRHARRAGLPRDTFVRHY